MGSSAKASYIREIRGARFVEFVPVGEREMWKLEKADKRAKMDDESGNGNPLVVVVRRASHA